MKQNLMDKYSAIKDWEQQYLLPTLEKLNAEIKKDFYKDICYSRIETDCKEMCCNWLISIVLKNSYQPSKEELIGEIILDIYIHVVNNILKLNADIGFDSGRILEEINSIDISTEEKDISLIDINNKTISLLNDFFAHIKDRISEGIDFVRNYKQSSIMLTTKDNI